MHCTLSEPQTSSRTCYELVPFRVKSTVNLPSVRLFVFSHAGGSVTGLRGLLEGFTDYFQVIGIELPGRGLKADSPLCWNLDDLVGELAAGITPFLTSSSLFMAYSFGGLVASELIRRFHSHNLTLPAGLVCFSAKPPRCVEQGKVWADLPEADLVQILQRLGGIPEAILRNPECVQMAMPSIRADLRCYAQYINTSAKPLECPVLAFCGGKDAFFPRHELEIWRSEVSEQHRALVSTCVLDGGHFCHIGNEKFISSSIVKWATTLGLMPGRIRASHYETQRFIWHPLFYGEN